MPPYQKMLRYLGAAFLVTVSFFVLVLSLTPAIISTERARSTIESYVRDRMLLPVRIADIHCTWQDGMIIKGVTLKKHRGPSPDSVLEIDKITFRIMPAKLFYGLLEFDSITDGIRIFIVRDENGKMNFEDLFPESPEKKSLKDPEKKKEIKNQNRERPFSIPFDIRAKVYFDEITILAADHLGDKHLELNNGRIHLDMPSLINKPSRVEVYAEPVLDKRRLPDVEMLFSAENMITPDKTVSLPNTKLSMKGVLPGSKISAEGSLKTGGIKSVCEIDLPVLQNTIMPFLPEDLSGSEIFGNIMLTIDADFKSDQSTVFFSSAEIKNFGISGQVIADKMFSGMNMTAVNKGVVGLSEKSLEISEGEFSFLNKTRFRYHGKVYQTEKGTHNASFSIDSSLLHLDEVFRYGRFFLKEDLPVHFGSGDDSPVLEAENLKFSCDFSSGSCDVAVDELNLLIPFLELESDEKKTLLRGIHFSLMDSTSDLNGFFPEQLNLMASCSIDEAVLRENNPIFLKKLEIPVLKCSAMKMQKNKNALFGFEGEISAGQTMRIQKMQAESLGEVEDLRQSGQVSFFLMPEKKVKIEVADFRIGTPGLKVKNEQPGFFHTEAELMTDVSGIEISRTDPVEINVNGLHTSLSFGNAVSFDFDADMSASKVKSIRTTGHLAVDLQQLFEKIHKKQDFFQKLSGTVETKWNIAGRIPENSEITKIKQLSIKDLKKDLDFIETVDIDISLRNLNTNFSTGHEKELQIGSLSADPLLHYVYHGESGNGDFNGKILMNDADGIPYLEAEKPFSSVFSYSGTHDGLKTITFSQNLESSAPDIEASLDLFFSGIDRAVLQKEGGGGWLNKCGGTLSAEITFRDTSGIYKLPKDFQVSGSLAAGLNLRLVPEKRIGGKSWIDFNNMEISRGELFSINDLDGKLVFEKEYLLFENDHAETASGDADQGELLSSRVIKTGYVERPERQLLNYDGVRSSLPITSGFDPEMTVGFETARSGKGPLPLDVEKFRAGIELNKGLPEIKRFQAQILGGSVLGSISVRKYHNTFAIPIFFSFTGIQTGKLFKGPSDKKPDDDTEMSGQFTVFLPVSAELSDFMNEIQVDILFTRIGSKALEQILYALDPQENNEKIVSQRKLLKKGYPRWIRLMVKDGNLSLKGVLSVQTVDVELPPLDRLNISGLSGLEPLEGFLLKLEPAAQVFKITSAKRILTNQGSRMPEFIED